MKTTLLRKMRKRMFSIDYSQSGVFIKYLDQNCNIASDWIRTDICSGFFRHGAFDCVMSDMFGAESRLIRTIMSQHEKTVKNRNILRVKNKKIEYKFSDTSHR